ncbi:MAG: MBL fold metallo-hydrolase [Pseudomonadota bacterium]
MKLSNTLRASLLTLLCWSATPGQAQTPSAPPDTRHHLAKTFTNPYDADHTGSLWGIFNARFFSGEWQTYDRKRDIIATLPHEIVPAGEVEPRPTVTWLGHSTLLLQHQGINVLTDPMFSKYASPVAFAGPRRISAPAVNPNELPPIHIVVISHNHYDHLDTPSIRALGNTPLYFVPLGLRRWFVSKGIDPDRVVEMDWWRAQRIEQPGGTITITATPSQHFSGRSLTDRDRTLWASWAINWSDFSAWFGGDTGYNNVQFKQIGEHFGGFDLGIIPIGAYKPRDFMRVVHVNPEEAVKIHKDINARQSMGMHWGTFVLSGEGVLTPVTDLAAARRQHQLDEAEFNVFAVGETRRY